MKIERIKSSMSEAAHKGNSFHLRCHAHNFGTYLEENLCLLTQILEHFKKLHQIYGMESKSMKSIAEEIMKRYAH